MTGPRAFIILKDFSLVKSNLLLGLMIWINIIFVFSIFYRKYIFIFFFLRVGPRTLFLSANFFIILLKNIRLCCNFFYNLQISSTYITIYSINSSHFLIFNKISASNLLFMKNGVLLVILCSEILYASILMGNSLTQLVYQQSQKYLRYCLSV